MVNTPNNVPIMCPTPPVSNVPPNTTAAITCISYNSPAVDCAAPSLDAKINPDNAAPTPQII